MQKFSFHSSQAFWPAQKLSQHELIFWSYLQSRHAKSEVKQVLRLKWNKSNPKSRGIYFTFLFGRFWDGWWDDLVNYFKYSIKLCALDIFAAFSCKNQNCAENHSI